MHGPPGCGKTALVAETARLCHAHLRVVHAQDVQGGYMGETEENLRREFAAARATAMDTPCILFLDELDALCPKRDVRALFVCLVGWLCVCVCVYVCVCVHVRM